MSLYIAKIIGPLLTIVSIGILTNLEQYRNLGEDFFKNFALCYISSAIITTLGLVMIHAHNIWSLHWSVIITVFSWLMFLKGALFIIFPTFFARFANIKNKTVYLVAAIIYLFLGIWLSLKGYAII